MEEDDSASHKFLNLIKEKREVFFLCQWDLYHIK